MSYQVIVIEPPEPIMAADEARAVIPALALADDGLVEGLIAAATAEIDGPAGWLGRAIGRQTLEMQRCGFPPAGGWIALPFPPVAQIEQVAYDNPDGDEIVIEPSQYQQRNSALALRPGLLWPSAACGIGTVRIQYEAGYADGEIPAPIKTAIQLRVGALFGTTRRDSELRKEVVEGIGSREWQAPVAGSQTATDKAIASLLAPYRIWGV
jgi:uncharacterized phiE125 gp8 family phage protein